MNKQWLQSKDDNYLAIMLSGWQKAFDDANKNKDLVFGLHAQQVLELIKEVIAERKAAA